MRAAWCAQRREKPANSAAAQSSASAVASPLKGQASIRIWILDLGLLAGPVSRAHARDQEDLALTADKTTTLDLP